MEWYCGQVYKINSDNMITQQNIESVYPHGSYVYRAHFKFDWNRLRPVCKNLIETTKHEGYLVEGGKTSVSNHKQPHLLPEFKDFYTWLKTIIKEVAINKEGFHKNFKYSVGNSWVNYHGEGGKTLEHNHSNAIFVAATYLYMPENGGYIEYKDPLEYHKAAYEHQDGKSWFWKEVPAVTGDVLIFPGWLKHRTQNNLSNEKRWVLTTNFIQTPELGGRIW